MVDLIHLRRLNTYAFPRKSSISSRSSRPRASPLVEEAVVMDTGVMDGVIGVVVGDVVVVGVVEEEVVVATVVTREGFETFFLDC